MSALHCLSASEQLALLRSRSVSVVELATEHIAAIGRRNPVLNAFVDFDPERVLDQARRLDAAPRALGPLHGLPVSIKSSIAAAGHRAEIGSLLHRGQVAADDAEAVRRLRASGALILGATNCPEFLMAYETDNLLYGQTRNPWDLERSPAGSSGGEAAAIAACLSAAGLGSDSGGSVRVPAHATGICSLKPTPGRIPGRGHLPPCVGPFSVLGSIGPMARTMDDVRLIFEAIAGQDSGDPSSAPVPLGAVNLEDLRRQPIAVFEDDGLVPVTPETRIAVRTAAEALREAGFRVEPHRPLLLEELRRLWWIFFVQCGAMFYAPTIAGREDLLSPIFREFLQIAGDSGPLSASELLLAWAELDLLRARVLDEMRSYPFWLCPVASVPAFRHGEREWTVEGRTVRYLDAVRPVQWLNTLGAPAAVVPVGRSPEGLPIGVQIAGRPYHDESVLALASVLGRNFGYQRPPRIDS